jgi:hypothetical protein
MIETDIPLDACRLVPSGAENHKNRALRDVIVTDRIAARVQKALPHNWPR